MILRVAVLIQYQSVTGTQTHTQTDRQTHRHTTTANTALSIASRGKNVSCDVTCPFQGRFVVRWLGLATINLYTKYEVSMLTHYEDMKGDEKYKNWGVCGG